MENLSNLNLKAVVEAARENWKTPNYHRAMPHHLGAIQLVGGQFMSYRVITKEGQYVAFCNSDRELAVILDLLDQPDCTEAECVAAYHLYCYMELTSQFNF